MVAEAVRARQLMKAIKAQDVELLHGLPDWAVSATMSQQVFMSNEDEYSGLWVSYPLDDNEIYVQVVGLPPEAEVEAIAFRAQPEDILIYRGEGRISVLTERFFRGWQ
jgi:hypothetical protein